MSWPHVFVFTERTQALLFKGMKQNMESDMAVDVNDNHTSYDTIYCDVHQSENSSLKQLHLNKNCELVHSQMAGSMEMETDLDMQSNQRETILKLPSSFEFNTPAAEHCETSTLPSFGLNFGRSSDALSPAESGASYFGSYSHENDQPLDQSSRNAFSLLMQSHVKNVGCSQKSLCRGKLLPGVVILNLCC